MKTMNPAIVVKILADIFGLSEAPASQVDLMKFDHIKTDLFEDNLIVEGVNTLVRDDLLSSDSDEDTDSDFGDDTPIYHEQQSPRHESSNWSYAPSPKRTRTKFQVGDVADAYKILTKLQREKDGSTDPPQLCLPGLATDSSPRVPFKTVMVLKRKIKNKTDFQKN
ncbi:hypothetical protein L9F63_024187 [Diploptera punctata]|uniref:Uncharacterized protein n=1 Tax=Diploptera punctata TaxID=6984 RepID=A0AAD7ZHV5_DIPPU|nr:hypothetical protein L9F63_024187 [Diploptera punctata]